MLVIITDGGNESTYIDDAAAVVRDRRGGVRICRDGLPDEFVDDNVSVCVVP